MKKLPAIAIGIAAAALAGTAIGATPKTHKMDMPLPDGSVAHIEYIGEVAPKVTIAPRPLADAAGAWTIPFSSFAGFDGMLEQMQRQSQEMIRRAQEMARHPAGPGGAAPYIASYGNLPAGGTSTTIVSVSNGRGTCTRTTQVVSQGAGKPAKVTSNISGRCAGGATAAPSSGAVNPV